MAKYRNISGNDLYVDLGGPGPTFVEDGAVMDTPAGFEDTHYVQTGDTGETPLFELVDGPAPANP